MADRTATLRRGDIVWPEGTVPPSQRPRASREEIAKQAAEASSLRWKAKRENAGPAAAKRMATLNSADAVMFLADLPANRRRPYIDAEIAGKCRLTVLKRFLTARELDEVKNGSKEVDELLPAEPDALPSKQED